MESQLLRLPIIQQFLDEQQELSAVERFSQRHDNHDLPALEPYYRELIPLSKPKSGEQYAFKVDLDACTGCKACVTACHSLNGLGEDETWRHVGMLHGGTPEAPVQQTVTTACHHCVDPACMSGCPVNAYEKDPETGIVRHLDDQCFGCQYCTLMCPYEVPQFNKSMGIVRKCDMCSDRLSEGEAPACVQACPNQAISIQIVEQAAVIENAQTDAFLPGAPASDITVPTTEYFSSKPFPKNMLPADFFNVNSSHHHPPLTAMLVLTQLSIGAYCVDWLLSYVYSDSSMYSTLRPWQSLASLALGFLALAASTLHLGRPHLAYRAFLGLRHSWLSREAVAFGAFAGLATLFAASLWHDTVMEFLGITPFLPVQTIEAAQRTIGGSVTVMGLFGVFCSVKVYAVTKKLWWRTSITSFKFFGTTALLGTSLALLYWLTAAYFLGVVSVVGTCKVLLNVVMVLSVVKLLGELGIFLSLRERRFTDMKRTAILLKRDFSLHMWIRSTLALVGGLLLPLMVAGQLKHSSDPTAAIIFGAFSLIALSAGELIERSLFFTAVRSPKMPGAVGA